MSATRRRLLLLFVLLLPLTACGGDPSGRAPGIAAGSDRLWKPLGTWSGRGDRQTESFDVTSGSLRLIWSSSGADGADAGHLRVALHSSISGRPIETIVDTHGAASDTSYVAAEPRVAYLLIESDRVDWRLTLEEGVQGEADPQAGSP